MARKSFALIAVLAAFVIGIDEMPGTTALGKEAQLGWYPPELEQMTSVDWPEIQRKLAAAVILDKTEAEPESFPAVQTASFVVARIRTISWTEDEKNKVSEFLGKYLIDVLATMKTASAMKQPASTQLADEYERLATTSIATCLAVDMDAGVKAIRNIWVELLTEPQDIRSARLRIAILDGLLAGFRNAAAVQFVQELQARTSATTSPIEKRVVDSFILRRTLFELADERKAWEHLWAISPKGPLSAMMTQDQRRLWYNNTTTMLVVYEGCSSDKLLSLAAEAGDPAERYAFLYAGCLLVNRTLGTARKEANDEAGRKMLQAIRAYQPVFEQDASYKLAGAAACDYLRDAANALEANLAAIGKPQP